MPIKFENVTFDYWVVFYTTANSTLSCEKSVLTQLNQVVRFKKSPLRIWVESEAISFVFFN